MTAPFRLTSYVPPEDQLHEAIAHMLWRLAPKDCFWTSHELRNARDAIEGQNRKRRGCKPGFPDLSVWHGGRVHLFEVKTNAGVLSAAQKFTHGQLAHAGHAVHVVRSPEAVEAILRAVGVRLSGRVAA